MGRNRLASEMRTPKATGKVPDIAHVARDKWAQAWNVVLTVDHTQVTLAALSNEHACQLCAAINLAAWVDIERATP